jgi:hypothetical protein
MEEAASDRKPGRVLTLYVPLALGVLGGAFTEMSCLCKMTWMQRLISKVSMAVGFFVFWWIAVMVCFHGYHFVCALFDHPSR